MKEIKSYDMSQIGKLLGDIYLGVLSVTKDENLAASLAIKYLRHDSTQAQWSPKLPSYQWLDNLKHVDRTDEEVLAAIRKYLG